MARGVSEVRNGEGIGAEAAGQGWIVLRTTASSTLRLAQSLAEDGYEVWTPVRRFRVRVPRANAKRNVELPLIPQYIFAREQHLLNLLELAAMPEKPRRGAGGRLPAHRDFSVFRHAGRIPVILDDDLKPLREAEDLAKPRRWTSAFADGSRVRITGGSFEGLVGTVESCDGRKAALWVSLFGRHRRVKISTFILQPVEGIGSGEARSGTAAKAA